MGILCMLALAMDVWLFLENLKATKNAFHFYSKADPVSMITNPLTPSIYTAPTPKVHILLKKQLDSALTWVQLKI